MRKSPSVKRMVKAGRQVRGMDVAKRQRRHRIVPDRLADGSIDRLNAPMPAPAHDNAQPINWSDEPDVVISEEQADAAQARPYNDLYDKKVDDLRAMAKDAGIKGYSKMRKNDLVEALS